MRQLPGASDGKHDKLDEHPSNNTGVGGLGLVTEFGFALLFFGQQGTEKNIQHVRDNVHAGRPVLCGCRKGGC